MTRSQPPDIQIHNQQTNRPDAPEPLVDFFFEQENQNEISGFCWNQRGTKNMIIKNKDVVSDKWSEIKINE